MKTRNIGISSAKTKEECNDNNCPVHGSLKCRGRTFTGTVISTKMQKTAIIEWERRYFLGKYERYEKRRSRVKAHNPICINVHEGDIAKIMECRPLSKTKNFVVVGVLGKEKGFTERMEAEEEAKTKVAEPKKEDSAKEEAEDGQD
ncbi:30S ribosomal protein S17 [Patescibacteria group bacterium]|nr:30S ribosomal protein S17 [Patescibacteria group bacterium]